MINSRHCFRTNTWKIVDQKLIFQVSKKKKQSLHFNSSDPKRGLLIWRLAHSWGISRNWLGSRVELQCAGVFSGEAVCLCLASKSEREIREKIWYGSWTFVNRGVHGGLEAITIMSLPPNQGMFYWGQPWLYPHREKIKTFVSPVVVSNLRTSSLWWGNGTPVIKRNRTEIEPSPAWFSEPFRPCFSLCQGWPDGDLPLQWRSQNAVKLSWPWGGWGITCMVALRWASEVGSDRAAAWIWEFFACNFESLWAAELCLRRQP